MILGDLQPLFGEANRLLRQINNSLCNSGGAASSVLVTNPTSNPVNVTIVPAGGAPIPQITSAGIGTIPAGFKSISIVKTSTNADSVTITLSDASVFTMTEQGEVFVDSATDGNLLPTYIIGGAGIIKWHGVK